MRKSQKMRFFITVVLLTSSLSGLLYLWVGTPHKSNDLKVAFLNIGQGDSIFIESPTGVQILIDAGPDKKVLSELSKVMPFYDRDIDIILATHPDKDHIGGIPAVLENYKVDMLIESGAKNENGVYDEIQSRAEALEKNNKLFRTKAYLGQVIEIGNGATLEILYPDRDVSEIPTNDASIVAVLRYKEKSFLFTGDAAFETEYRILRNPTLNKVNVLKVGHHGSQYSTGTIFMERISPEYAVISVGKNTYGHPTQTVLNLLSEFKSETLRTDQKGRIIFSTDGHNMSYTTERK